MGNIFLCIVLKGFNGCWLCTVETYGLESECYRASEGGIGALMVLIKGFGVDDAFSAVFQVTVLVDVVSWFLGC